MPRACASVRARVPKIFISSTVRDLRDLRSAIKYWLEQYGFEVLASEWPDFAHPLDREAIAAALAPIELSDYYLLIVVYRVGLVLPVDGLVVPWAQLLPPSDAP